MGLARAETLTRDYRVERRRARRVARPVGGRGVDRRGPLHPARQREQVRAAGIDDSRQRRADATGSYVGLAVADEGPGIPIDARERVFEKFFRVPGRESHDPRRKGIGLGLPIARRLVEAQGGRIWIDSPASGAGTLVQLMLPVGRGPGSQSRRSTTRHASGGQPDSELGVL